MLVCVQECQWNAVASKKDREKKRKKKIYAGNTQLLVAICIYGTIFKVNHVYCALALLPTAYIEMETQRNQRKHFSFSISLPPFIPPLPSFYKGQDHYKCPGDRWELSITLLELRFVGFAPTQFTALLKCGWAQQAAQLVPCTQMYIDAEVKVQSKHHFQHQDFA